jgi:hypothetical protein
MTIDCPLDCEYLIESRRHAKPVEISPAAMPNADVRVSESFLREHEQLLMAVAGFLFEGAMQVPGAVDLDVRDALEALIKTYKTRGAGLIYESRPANPLAAAIQQLFEQRLAAFVEAMRQRSGIMTVRDSEVMGLLVFLQRLELQNNNGRRRGRAFLDLLRGFFPASTEPPPSSLLV